MRKGKPRKTDSTASTSDKSNLTRDFVTHSHVVRKQKAKRRDEQARPKAEHNISKSVEKNISSGKTHSKKMN